MKTRKLENFKSKRGQQLPQSLQNVRHGQVARLEKAKLSLLFDEHEEVGPTPFTLHSTPYTLHPTLYTLHSTPYTLHPTLYTLHPHQQCDVNYREIRRPTVCSYKFHRRIDGEGMRPYEKLPIPTDPDIVHITLLVACTLHSPL